MSNRSAEFNRYFHFVTCGYSQTDVENRETFAWREVTLNWRLSIRFPLSWCKNPAEIRTKIRALKRKAFLLQIPAVAEGRTCGLTFHWSLLIASKKAIVSCTGRFPNSNARRPAFGPTASARSGPPTSGFHPTEPFRHGLASAGSRQFRTFPDRARERDAPIRQPGLLVQDQCAGDTHPLCVRTVQWNSRLIDGFDQTRPLGRDWTQYRTARRQISGPRTADRCETGSRTAVLGGTRYRPLAALADAVQIVRGLLRHETVTYCGRAFSADRVASSLPRRGPICRSISQRWPTAVSRCAAEWRTD